MQKKIKSVFYIGTLFAFLYSFASYIISICMKYVDKSYSSIFNITTNSLIEEIYLKTIFINFISFILLYLFTYIILKLIFKFNFFKREYYLKLIKVITIYLFIFLIISSVFSYTEVLVVNKQFENTKNLMMQNLNEEKSNEVFNQIEKSLDAKKKYLNNIMYGNFSISIIKHILSFGVTIYILRKYINKNLDCISKYNVNETMLNKNSLTLVFKLCIRSILIGIILFGISLALILGYYFMFKSNNNIIIKFIFRILIYTLPCICILATSYISTKYFYIKNTSVKENMNSFKKINYSILVIFFILILIISNLLTNVYVNLLYKNYNPLTEINSNNETIDVIENFIKNQIKEISNKMKIVNFSFTFLTFVCSIYITEKNKRYIY